MADRLIPTGPFTVPHSEGRIRELLVDLFAEPRKAVYKWSRITGQTAQVRLAYPGQHLASVVTGTPGAGTAARGDDLEDGSEVKSCSRADQLGDCTVCQSNVLASLDACPACGSTDIDRKTDSHWIIAVKTEAEVDLLLRRVPRVVLVLFDRPADDARTVQIRIWEIWPRSQRNLHFVRFVEDYYANNFRRKLDQGLRPAPCNLHPLKFDFYLMNPLQTFRATVHERDDDAEVVVHSVVPPDADRCGLESEPMPTRVLRPDEFLRVARGTPAAELLRYVPAQQRDDAQHAVDDLRVGRPDPRRVQRAMELVPLIDEDARSVLEMRKKRIKETPPSYRRR